MWKTIEKIAALFCIIVFITFMINHGHIDFSGVDWVKNKTTEVVTSDEGQQYINETKEISKGVFHDLFYGIKEFITGEGDPNEVSDENSFEAATLLSVSSGDTIKVKIDGTETTVKLLGIESSNSLDTSSAKEAFDYVEAILENIDTLYLEYDVSKTDSSGCTLAYAWISPTATAPETNMINAIIIKNGYGDDAVYLPNNKYTDLFIELKQQAQDNNAGLWKNKEFAKAHE